MCVCVCARVRVRVCVLSRVRHSLCLCVSKFLWVGILEKMGESLELLEYQGGYERGFTVATKNAHKHNAKATDEEKAKLAALMPMDVWFYDHVKVRSLPPSLPPSLSLCDSLSLSLAAHTRGQVGRVPGNQRDRASGAARQRALSSACGAHAPAAASGPHAAQRSPSGGGGEVRSARGVYE